MAPDNGWPSTATWTQFAQTFQPELQKFATALNQWQTTLKSAGRAAARLLDALVLWKNPRERDRYHLARARIPTYAPPPSPLRFDVPQVRMYALRINSAGRPGRRRRRHAVPAC